MTAKFRSVFILLSLFTMTFIMVTIWTQSKSQREKRNAYNSEKQENKLIKKGDSTSMVILISEARSGSNFLAELLASKPSVFYFYEPLQTYANKVLDDNFVRQRLKDLLTCEMSGSLKKELLSGSTVQNKQNCGKQCNLKKKLVPSCRLKQTKLIKTTRTSISTTKPLLDSLPDLKIIQLVRDPRGMLHSIFERGWTLPNETEKIQNTCNNIQINLHHGTELENEYPGRYLLVRYEDLCDDPWKEATRIFKFLGYNNLNLSVHGYLVTHTNSVVKDPFSTHRDTLNQAQRWRKNISEQELNIIESLCMPLINQMGLRVFNSTDNVHNMSIPIQ